MVNVILFVFFFFPYVLSFFVDADVFLQSIDVFVSLRKIEGFCKCI